MRAVQFYLLVKTILGTIFHTMLPLDFNHRTSQVKENRFPDTKSPQRDCIFANGLGEFSDALNIALEMPIPLSLGK